MPRAVAIESTAAKKPAAKRAVKEPVKPAAFEGFADTRCKFFHELSKNQDREWFQAHKEIFERGWNQPMAALLAEVVKDIDRAFPDCDLGQPKLFRIYRDVRFGKDKSPYKTHIGGHIMARSRRAESVTEVPMALYFQAGTETFAAAGQYMMSSEALTRFRAAVADPKRGPALQKILSRLQQKGFEPGAFEMMANVPRGYGPDHPRADLLRHKGLMVRFPKVPTALMTKPALRTWLSEHIRLAAPLVRWLVFATS